MSEQIKAKIISHLQSGGYQPTKPRVLARELQMEQDEHYPAFRAALKELMGQGRIVLGGSGSVVLPSQKVGKDEFVGSYRHNKRGFGFVIPSDPSDHEDLYIPEGENGGAINNDIVRAKITSRGQRGGKTIYTGRIMEILERTNSQFVGSLMKQGNTWMVLPDGNQFTEAILTPDAGSRYIKPGTKVVVEITEYPEYEKRAVGVITEVLGEAGAKDVDLKSVIVQHNLPDHFPEEVLAQARHAVESFDPEVERQNRMDLSGEIVCTIDPDDAKDYDDAISLKQLDGGLWELGVHIADV